MTKMGSFRFRERESFRTIPLPIALVFVAFAATGAVGQRAEGGDAAVRPAGLPAAVAEEVTRRLNDPATEVHEGDFVIGSGVSEPGSLAILGGSLSLAGEVEGDVLVVNGDLEFVSGARVGGGVMVVGGSVVNTGAARVGGEIVRHDGEYLYERRAGRFLHLDEPGGRARAPGTNDFLITTGRSYNRVEGLPIAFGPRLRTAGSNPLRIQALGVYRTESGFTLDVDRMGYYVRADQYLAGRREIRVGATLHSMVDPIEEWHLSDLETGLATFLFHRDYRDHYERTGWSIFTHWEPIGSPVRLSVEGRWDKHEMRASGSPWSLFRNADPWRHQPVVAEGRLGSIIASGEYDSRSSEWNPASGWLARLRLEHAFHTDLAYPAVAAAEPPSEQVFTLVPDYGRFLAAFADIRSYNRVDAESRLNFRLVAGGSLTGDPLPPQRQHALGGEGSLPGYALFSGDCGARAAPVARAIPGEGIPGDPFFFPHYGCDAFGLVQAEYRGKLSFRFRWDGGPWRDDPRDDDATRDIGWDMSPDWSLFVDAGRGWTHHHDRPDQETMVNVGAGILLDRFGLYLAVPVTGGSGVNLFVRLGPRF
jgi:hypothetical protein